ncbi:uncharacterized protein BXIN_2912 [Babesia sp. Xinjiang]|uniref:uncharacterized protein n=1 Tax=Babesia sp. Xinjiang TaxID=462227 RepID=UPI000A2409C0|nr:uncharacterized protein BXIN_2912 [Babesia sp. Xinjiang]ORM39594.1 hypothetical protein BXIN_2912 [Babesia sp. Xinjiang]
MTTADDRDRDSRASHQSKTTSRHRSNSITSIRGIAMSFASSEYGTIGSFDAGVNVRDVLIRRSTAESRAEGLRHFRTDASQHTIYNSRRIGVVLLLLGIFNAAFFVLLQIRRGLHTECTFNVPDKPSAANGQWTYTVTHSDCVGDVTRFASAPKVYVYYSIHNYPHHGSAVYKLHSKEQLEGKDVEKEDLKKCFPYNAVLVDGKERLVYPCGPHLWYVYNDTFKFTMMDTSASPVAIELDESQELLGYRQEYTMVRNPPTQEISRSYKNTYYWLLPETKTIKTDDSPVYKISRPRGAYLDIKTPQQLQALQNLMTSPKSGIGIENAHVVQWMTPPPFKTFKKLYGSLVGPIALPLYVTGNIAYDTEKYGGSKTLSLVVPSWPYGRLISAQNVLGVLAALCLALSFVLLVSKPGDPGRCANLL